MAEVMDSRNVGVSEASCEGCEVEWMEASRNRGWHRGRVLRGQKREGFGRAFDKSQLSPACTKCSQKSLAEQPHRRPARPRTREPAPPLPTSPNLGLLCTPNRQSHYEQPAAVPLPGEKSEPQSRQKVVILALAQEKGQSTRPRHAPAQLPSRRARPPLETFRQDGPGQVPDQRQRHRRQAHPEWRCCSRSSAAQDAHHSSTKHRGR
jgi:hypothetical protein